MATVTTSQTHCTTSQTCYTTSHTHCTTSQTRCTTSHTHCTTSQTRCTTSQTHCTTSQTHSTTVRPVVQLDRTVKEQVKLWHSIFKGQWISSPTYSWGEHVQYCVLGNCYVLEGTVDWNEVFKCSWTDFTYCTSTYVCRMAV